MSFFRDDKLFGIEDAEQLISVCSKIQRVVTAIIKASKTSPQALKS
jgi:hypothetical protein